MPIYNIADITMDVVSDFPIVYEKLNDYVASTLLRFDFKVDITSSDMLYSNDDHHDCSDRIQEDETIASFFHTQLLEKGNVLSKIEVDAAWQYSRISCDKNYLYGHYGIIEPLLEMCFRYKLIFYQGLVIHAAALNLEGRGILFSAPSGTGKTTQAGLWKKHMGARVMNGDRAAVRLGGDKAVVYGIPWSGSSRESYNGKAPLSAIVILKQSPDNKVRRLSGPESAALLLPRCFLPSFDKEMMNIAVNTFTSLINIVPVYLLECRPDKEAVDVLSSRLG